MLSVKHDETEMYVEISRLIVNLMIIQNADVYETDDTLELEMFQKCMCV